MTLPGLFDSHSHAKRCVWCTGAGVVPIDNDEDTEIMCAKCGRTLSPDEAQAPTHDGELRCDLCEVPMLIGQVASEFKQLHDFVAEQTKLKLDELEKRYGR